MTQLVAIIFGGSRGIGAATARHLGAHGVSVVIAARNKTVCSRLGDEIRGAGGKALAIECDVTRHDQVAAAIDATLKAFGRIDFVINSAGAMDPIGMIEDCSPEDWAQCIGINLTGSFNVCHAVIPHLRAQGGGVIVNMSSGAAFHALAGWSAYCVAKAGLAMLTQSLATELEGTDIRIYGFQPGMVNTGLTRDALQHKVNRVAELDPEEFMAPDVPAAAIAWLCHQRPSDLSGTEIDLTALAFQQRLSAAPDYSSPEILA